MNISALNNITPFAVNNTIINNTQDTGANLVNNANTMTGGYFGLGIMIAVFLLLMLTLMSQQDLFRLSFISALGLSSGMSLIIGIVGLVSGLFTNYQHVMWFAILFAFALVFKNYERR